MLTNLSANPRLGSPLPNRPTVSAPSPLAPALPARARAADVLMNIKTLGDYRNVVIRLVAQSISVQQELDQKRKDRNEGKASLDEVLAVQERLNYIKAQLELLKNQFPIPAEWTSKGLLGLTGPGFDKEAFWNEQLQAVPTPDVLAVDKTAPVPASLGQPVERFEDLLASAGVTRYCSVSSQDERCAAANAAYMRALSACRTPEAAMQVAKSADYNEIDVIAPRALRQAGQLAATSAQALKVAIEVEKFATEHRINSAWDAPLAAFDRGFMLAKNPREILAVAEAAAAWSQAHKTGASKEITSRALSVRGDAVSQFNRAVDQLQSPSDLSAVANMARLYELPEVASRVEKRIAKLTH